ncbi:MULTISPECIES: SLATT domain-containing protein [Yersinia]|uniref:SLATT domain-containing protein n=1 Tax=Yersinia TaxID=629 RepID=UPI0005DB0E73|nr:SLATT domain-containing protein [Yersinia pseudotuberculosis]EKN5087673.1 SLATT domain-containing protein [Yersinia enterocolitica]CND62401.1 Uncharacterised protein [Yersinia pseudotuberculosis]
MNQSEMLKIIARRGYNVGFGAKKNFATYDIVSKAGGWISFISLCIGVFALFIPILATNVISAILIIFGVITMYVQFYDAEKGNYIKAGNEQTRIFEELEFLYRNVKSDANFDYEQTHLELTRLMTQFQQSAISKHIFCSNWYAHYKFYCEFEKEWVSTELSLTWKDKIPFSLAFFIIMIIIVSLFAINY